MPAYIDLQEAHVTQLTESGTKGPWMVRQNATSKDLHELPFNLSDPQVFAVMDFARKFELIAFNAGIDFQKGKQNSCLHEQVSRLKKETQLLTDQKERLESKLLAVLQPTD